MAIKLFTKLESLVRAYESAADYDENSIEAIKKQIFQPLLVDLNFEVNSLKTSIKLQGFIWFHQSHGFIHYNLVEHKQSLSPITNFLNMLDISYYPNVELVMSRRFGKKVCKTMACSHAPLLLYSLIMMDYH